MEFFDVVLTKILTDHIDIDYGILEGNNTIVFIKVGQNGNIYGFENKYLQIATQLRESFGYTVIVSSNPFDGNNPLDQAFEVIQDYCSQKGFETYEVRYMGHSNGALIGFTWGHHYPQITHMLLINAPLMVNWHKSKAGLSKIHDKVVTFVYGEKDPSHFFVRHLHPFAENNEHVNVVVVTDADHNFTGMMESFLNLPHLYLGGTLHDTK